MLDHFISQHGLAHEAVFRAKAQNKMKTHKAVAIQLSPSPVNKQSCGTWSIEFDDLSELYNQMRDL